MTHIHQQLEQLQAISHAIPHLLKTKKRSLPILGLDDSIEDVDGIYGLRNFQDSVNKEIEVLEEYIRKGDQGSNFSTNAPYFIAVWNEIMSAPPPIIALGKKFPSPIGKNKTDMTNKTVKVDVVANEGRTWIRVNTIKNSRLIAEFHEFDSYLTGSEDETEKPLANDEDLYFPTDQDNSLLRMGRALIRASSIPLIGTNERPKVVLRLTRLDPAKGQDSRMSQVIDDLRQLGLDVQLGERPFRTITDNNEDLPPILCQPTNRINLDLSVLIALISDLIHAHLPVNREEAKSRFSSAPLRIRQNGKQVTDIGFQNDDQCQSNDTGPVKENDDEDNNFTKHSRALFLQCLQEIDRGILTEMVEHLSVAWPIETVQFWTTKEARDRTLQIVEKVGGPNEKKRARAMFYDDDSEGEKKVPHSIHEFWENSRHPSTFFPTLLPIRILHKPHSSYEGKPSRSAPLFHSRLAQTCQRFLKHAATPHPRLFRKYGEMGRAQVSSLNVKLTMHTVESMLVGSYEGMTTITANKASVKTLLREMKALENLNDDSLDNCAVQFSEKVRDGGSGAETFAAIWIIEPRSLAENMRIHRQNTTKLK